MTDSWLAERMAVLLDAGDDVVARGRYLTTTMLVEVGDQSCLVDIEHGRVTSVRPGPFVMPSWTFAIRAHPEDWGLFWSPVPPPGTHDLFALLKRGRVVFEGNLAPLMANLLYIKEILAMPRTSPAGARS